MIHYYRNEYASTAIGLDPSAPAFRYGVGFFETMYYDGSALHHLELHLDRLLHALRAHGIPYDTVDFDTVIAQVLKRNGLTDQPARVNIFYPLEHGGASPVILAAPHEPKPYKAYRLCICDDRHVSTLNGYKTTSYMFFHLAMQQAKARGFDDAVLFDLENNILEATTGALVFQKERTFVSVDSPYRLPSTALTIATKMLDILPVKVPLDELESFRHAYILNSVIGMRPVVSIGETAFIPDEDACQTVMAQVIGS